jgi:hypothetical protein
MWWSEMTPTTSRLPYPCCGKTLRLEALRWLGEQALETTHRVTGRKRS